jgi:hypothetical protein
VKRRRAKAPALFAWSASGVPSENSLSEAFAIGQRPLIEALERVKGGLNSYPLDCLAIAGAVAAIEDLTVEQLVAVLSIEALAVTVFPGTSWFDVEGLSLGFFGGETFVDPHKQVG